MEPRLKAEIFIAVALSVGLAFSSFLLSGGALNRIALSFHFHGFSFLRGIIQLTAI